MSPSEASPPLAHPSRPHSLLGHMGLSEGMCCLSAWEACACYSHGTSHPGADKSSLMPAWLLHAELVMFLFRPQVH